MEWLQQYGIEVSDWQPLESYPVPRPDITLNGTLPVEIKTSSPGAKSFCINEGQRLKFAQIPNLMYWPIVRIGENQLQFCRPIPASEVADVASADAGGWRGGVQPVPLHTV